MMGYFIGHLVGDYLLQNDWMAQNKKGPLFPPSLLPGEQHDAWMVRERQWRRGTLACALHVVLYTLAAWAFTGWPLWALAIVALTHFIQDRTDIILWWMKLKWKDQTGFATAPGLAPWSIIVVDNVWHLLVLHLIFLGVGA